MPTASQFLCAAAVTCAASGVVHAQHSVRLTAGLERIENPLLVVESPGGATILRIAPSYEYEAQGDQSRSRFSAGAVLERSSNTDLVASRNYPSLGYTWAYAWPTAELELRAALAEAATRTTELRDLGRITTDGKERSIVAGARWSKELTARTRLMLNASNNRVSYDSALLESYRELEISSRFSWEATERATYYLEPVYARLTPSGAGASSSQTRWRAGMRSAVAPDWSLTAFVGQARTGGQVARSATGSLSGLSLAYTGSRLSSGVDWSRDVVANSSATGYVGSDALILRLGYRIAEGTEIRASTTRSQSDGSTGSRGTVSSLTLENNVGVHWSSTVGIEDRRSRAATGASGKGWSVRAGLTYLYPGR